MRDLGLKQGIRYFMFGIFLGYQTLPRDYPSYDPSGNDEFHNSTKWVSKLMSLKSFFNDYQHFYVTSRRDSNGRYFLYDSPPTYNHNWQWDANPDQFYEETSLYNGVRAADLSKLCFLPILNKTTSKPK